MLIPNDVEILLEIAALFAFTLTIYAGWTFYDSLKESKYDDLNIIPL